MQTRKCTKCGITKSLDQFYQQSKKYKDGSPKYDARCIQCMRGAALKRYYQARTPSSHPKVPKVSTPLSGSTQPLSGSTPPGPRPLSRLPQRPPFRQVQPPPKPTKPTPSQGVRRAPLAQERHYVVDEYSQVDPNSDDL